jgi:hypothetical protein
MEYFEKKLELEKQEEKLPLWVSKSNATYKAWIATEKKKGERIIYIKNHPKESHFKLKGSYQISGAEVAKAVGIDRVTLTSSSAYSNAFKTYLKSVNEELNSIKEARLEKAKKSKNKGLSGNTKQEVIAKAGSLKTQYDELLKQNAASQVEHAINMLHPDVAELLILEQQPKSAKVTRIGKK